MIELLFISHVIILGLTYRLLDKDLSSPSFLFLSGFTLCSYIAYCYRNEWELGLHFGTYLLITSGSILFLFIEKLYRIKKSKIFLRSYDINLSKITIPVIDYRKLILFAVLQTVIYYLHYRHQMSFTGETIWSNAIGEIDQDKKFGDKTFFLPWYINVPYAFCQASGFVWICLFVLYLRQFLRFKRECFLVIVNMLLSMAGSLLSGGRMPLLGYLVPLVILLYISYSGRKRNKQINLKSRLIIIILAILFVGMFSQIGTLIGRKEADNMDKDYVFAVYCGAEVKLLDNYINSSEPKRVHNFLPCPSSFKSFYMFFVDRLGVDISFEQENYDFQYNGRYFLGNVYTCYRPFFNDLGYMGFLLAGLMSYFACILYSNFWKSSFFSEGYVDIKICLYCFFTMSLFLSFFAELFFRRLFSVEYLIRTIIYLYIVIFFLYDKKLRRI